MAYLTAKTNVKTWTVMQFLIFNGWLKTGVRLSRHILSVMILGITDQVVPVKIVQLEPKSKTKSFVIYNVTLFDLIAIICI